MSHRMICYTLFDITQTGVSNRSKPPEDHIEEWKSKRNSQCNLDTILQVISLRSQPEQISVPKKFDLKLNEVEYFGFLLSEQETVSVPCWTFNFSVQHPSVFYNGITELGALYNDCHGVPMLLSGNEYPKTNNFLDSTPELRNIYFSIVNE
jgi:hypothetical protein